MLAGIIACVLAVLGILFLGFVFVPLALIVAIIGTILALKARVIASIGVNILALILVFIGLVTSPVLLALIGISAGAISSSGSSSKGDAKEVSIRTDINTILQSVPARYSNSQEVSIINAWQLDKNTWKQNGNKAEYIYCDDTKTSGINCAGGKITLKIVLLTPDESNSSRVVNIAVNKEAVSETNGIVTPATIGTNDPWIVLDVAAKNSGPVYTLSRDFAIYDTASPIKHKRTFRW
jgi:energy-coupling factor transporter transmembrane protein EcfT